MKKIDVYFTKACELRFVPPAALISSELGSLDAIKASPIGAMVKPDKFVFGTSGADNNWTKAHYIEGAQLIDGVVDVILLYFHHDGVFIQIHFVHLIIIGFFLVFSLCFFLFCWFVFCHGSCKDMVCFFLAFLFVCGFWGVYLEIT